MIWGSVYQLALGMFLRHLSRLVCAIGRVEPNYISWSVLSFAHTLISGFSKAYVFLVAARFKSVVINRRSLVKFFF